MPSYFTRKATASDLAVISAWLRCEAEQATDRCAKKVKLFDGKIEGWNHRDSSLMTVVSGGGYVHCT